MDTKELIKDAEHWTPDRPTKPGKYWLSVHPDKRGILFEAGVYEVVLWAADQKVRHIGGLTIVPEDRLIGAQWLPYVEPPDPFAEPVPPSEIKTYRLSDAAKTPNLSDPPGWNAPGGAK